jgi:uncharacterized lipoprotein YbaY
MRASLTVYISQLTGAALLALTGWQSVAAAAALAATPLASNGAVFEVLGQASYRERVALPPQAVFTVRVEDVSRADAASKLMAEQTRPVGRQQVPLDFKLTLPKAAVDPRHRYALRATIHVDGQLRFTSTQHYPVLKETAAEPLAVLLQSVAQSSAAPEADRLLDRSAGLNLPQSFAGVLPCADCAGIVHTLTLLAYGVYRLRLTYLGKPALPFVEQGCRSIGQPAAGSGSYQLTLRGATSEGRYFLIQSQKNEGAVEVNLRQLDRAGRPFTSSANQLLRPIAQLDQIDGS